MTLRSFGLCFALTVTACQSDAGGGTAPSAVSTSEHPGWLVDNDREIIRLQLELAAGEPTAAQRMRAVAASLAELEKGRLPASWTETMFIVSKATKMSSAAKIIWTTLVRKDDIDPLVAATCKKGQLGLENMANLMDRVATGMSGTFEGLVFRQCKVKERGLFDAPDDMHHGALVFALIAFQHLKANNTLSPEEADALRKFVTYFSEFYRANRVIAGKSRQPKRKPAATASASGAPSAVPPAPSAATPPSPSPSAAPKPAP